MKPANEDSVKVSACIVTYNQAAYIRDCLEGVINQEVDFGYEIVIGDDCSSDGTSEICEEYAANYPTLVRYHRREKNLGMHGNWLQTLMECKGEYIAICEGDDYWTESIKLQKQVKFLESNPDYSICFHNVYVTYNERNVYDHLFHEKHIPITTTIETILRGNYINTCSVIYRNQNKAYPDYIYKSPVGDWVLHVHFAQLGKIYYMNQPMATYRIHSGGIYQHHYDWSVERFKENKRGFIFIREQMLKQFSYSKKLTKIIRERINYNYMELVILALKTRPIKRMEVFNYLRFFLTSGITLKNFLRLLKKTSAAIVRLQ